MVLFLLPAAHSLEINSPPTAQCLKTKLGVFLFCHPSHCSSFLQTKWQKHGKFYVLAKLVRWVTHAKRGKEISAEFKLAVLALVLGITAIKTLLIYLYFEVFHWLGTARCCSHKMPSAEDMADITKLCAKYL